MMMKLLPSEPFNILSAIERTSSTTEGLKDGSALFSRKIISVQYHLTPDVADVLFLRNYLSPDST
jgi:hypothetical protein